MLIGGGERGSIAVNITKEISLERYLAWRGATLLSVTIEAGY
jgi:hypothetical protein